MNRSAQILCALTLSYGLPALGQEAIPIPHIQHYADGDLERMADEIKSGLFRVRSVSTPDGLFQPIPIEGDGLAVWLTIGEDKPALVTTYGYVSAAQVVEVLIGGEWVAAEVEYGSPLFDLAVLNLAVDPPAEDALTLIEAWPNEASVYVPLATSDSTGRSEVVIGMLGGELPDMLSYYIRAHFWQRNGYPIVSREGEVMAIAAIFAPDGEGVLAIPYAQIAAWRDEWETLDPENPYDHQLNVRIERLDPTIEGAGSEVEALPGHRIEQALPAPIPGRFDPIPGRFDPDPAPE